LNYIRINFRGTPNHLVPVQFADDASRIFSDVRDAGGFGASDMKAGCGELIDGTGEVIGQISYNGRIWKTAKPVEVPCYHTQRAYQMGISWGDM
jgi:hypothetical protein